MFAHISSNTIHHVLCKVLLSNINKYQITYCSFDELTFVLEKEYYKLRLEKVRLLTLLSKLYNCNGT